MLYIISVSLLILGIAILFSVNDLNDKVKRIEAGQSKIQHKILNSSENFDFYQGFAIEDDSVSGWVCSKYQKKQKLLRAIFYHSTHIGPNNFKIEKGWIKWP